MTVDEILKLLAHGTRWQLIGARTGKKLCNYLNRGVTLLKYADMEVTSRPIVAGLEVNGDVKHINDFVVPMITIWVLGE